MALSLPVRLEYRARGTLGVVLAVHLKDPRNITGSLNPTVLVSTRGFKNELCHLRSVLVSAHCFKKELCFLCSVLVLTHRFKNDLCVPTSVLVSTHGFKNEFCCLLGLPFST